MCSVQPLIGTFTYFISVFSLLQAKISLNITRQVIPSIDQIFSSPYSSKTLCVWVDKVGSKGQSDTLQHILQSYDFAYIISSPGKVNINAKMCYENLVIFLEFLKIKHFFDDRIPSDKHVFVVIDNTNTSLGMNRSDYKQVKKSFGFSKTIFMQQQQIFKLSSPFFPPRKLTLVNKLAELQDQKLSNLRGVTVNVATFNCSLFSILHGHLHTGFHDGIEMRMLVELAQRLNFTYVLLEPGEIEKWGSMLTNGTWVGGIMGLIENGDADLGFCNVWNSQRYLSVVDFGPQWNVVYCTIMVPRPHLVYHFWTIVVQLFQKSVWVILLATFCLVCILFLKFRSAGQDTVSDIVESVLTVFGVMIATTSHMPPSGWFARRIITCWSVFSFFISALFCNMIITRIMVPQHSFLINSVEDIVQQNFFLGEPGYSNSSKKILYINYEDPWQSKLASQYRYLDKNNSKTALKSGRFVFPVQLMGYEFVFVNVDGLDPTDLDGFRVMKQVLNRYFVSFVFSKNSPLLSMCYPILQQFVEVGLVDHWKKDVVLQYGSPNEKNLLSDPHTETVDPFKPLRLANNIAAFKILLTGWFLAIIVFLFEIFFGQKFKHELSKSNFGKPSLPQFPYCE